ncbi:hypothetical protein Shyhy02_14190 [Streptomyces hygroscopicus subsp. hygroscopicus]|nr:hypothetical protein Shyhy02_14190 [Streptomyces hygroscopicus subsp. hygroscopicus]
MAASWSPEPDMPDGADRLFRAGTNEAEETHVRADPLRSGSSREREEPPRRAGSPYGSAVSPAGAVTSIFDLDGVLTREDTMASLVGARLAARPHRLVAAIAPFLLAQAAPLDGALRPAMNRATVALALRGMARSEYERLAVAQGHGMAGRTTVVQQAVARCRTARLQGPTVVATASEATLARAFLDGVGLRDIPLAASRLAYTRRGPRLAAHTIGEAKLAAVRAMGFVPEDAVFYTDSASDIPLARVARRTVTVNAARRSITKLEAIARDITHERWQ